eukprot:GHVU01088091.1.p1 GENE.GHVU01088091.1~~GHVU01088091.1.p1  ORF type:complete len:502 (-),score=66.53 GHVU01088091.1:2346-3851(-)
MKEFATVIAKGKIGLEVKHDCKDGEMKMRWRLTEKENNISGERSHKARWFAKGFMSKQRGETFAGTPNLFLVLLCLTFGLLNMKWAAYTTDVTAAFLNAELGDYRAVIILDQAMPTLPEISPFIEFNTRQWSHIRAAAAGMKPGQHRLLKKALYGDRRSPYFWATKLRSMLGQLGYTEIHESISVKHQGGKVAGIIANHVDDLVVTGDDPRKDMEELKKEVELAAPVALVNGKPLKWAGIEFTLSDHSLHASQTSFLNDLHVGAQQPLRVVTEDDLREATEDEVDLGLVAEYQSLIGKLGWAVKTRPNQYVWFAELSRHITRPAARLLATVKNVLHGLAKNPEGLTYTKVSETPTLVGYCDASFSRKPKGSRTGFKVYLKSNISPDHDETNLIAWGTKRITVAIDSSTAAELYALKHLVKQIPKYIEAVTKLWGERPKVQFYTDCKPLHDIVRKGSFEEDSLLNFELRFVSVRMYMLDIGIDWIPRVKQRADALTKCVRFM